MTLEDQGCEQLYPKGPIGKATRADHLLSSSPLGTPLTRRIPSLGQKIRSCQGAQETQPLCRIQLSGTCSHSCIITTGGTYIFIFWVTFSEYRIRRHSDQDVQRAFSDGLYFTFYS